MTGDFSELVKDCRERARLLTSMLALRRRSEVSCIVWDEIKVK